MELRDSMSVTNSNIVGSGRDWQTIQPGFEIQDPRWRYREPSKTFTATRPPIPLACMMRCAMTLSMTLSGNARAGADDPTAVFEIFE